MYKIFRGTPGLLIMTAAKTLTIGNYPWMTLCHYFFNQKPDLLMPRCRSKSFPPSVEEIGMSINTEGLLHGNHYEVSMLHYCLFMFYINGPQPGGHKSKIKKYETGDPRSNQKVWWLCKGSDMMT